MFEIIKKGIFTKIKAPEYGKQDIGVTPGGALDSFSYETGNIMLKNKPDAPALEIILAPALQFKHDCYFILTGAKHQASLYHKGKSALEHGRVCFAPKGSVIEFGAKEYGFRTYLSYVSADRFRGSNPVGNRLGTFNDIASWQDEQGKIRLIEGPEYKYLADKTSFLNDYWKISNDTSAMGMRIENKRIDLRLSMKKSMVSEAVSNGTIQMTPGGPIILLKHRQTVGGYPRIFNVISVDVDLLAQFSPGQIIHFKKTTIGDAHLALKKRQNDIARLVI